MSEYKSKVIFFNITIPKIEFSPKSSLFCDKKAEFKKQKRRKSNFFTFNLPC